MGRRGPKPDPASVKKAKGNPGHRALGEDPVAETEQETQEAMPRVAAPDWLMGEGLEIWNKLASRMISQKLLFQIDAEAFGRYCMNFARWLRMQVQLDARGETYESESPHGTYLRANPAYMIADRLERQLVAAEANFGLNPAERQRLFAARAGASLGGLFDPADPAPKPTPAPTDKKQPAEQQTGLKARLLN